MIYFNQQLTVVFFGLMALGYAYFSMTQHHRDASADNKVAV